MRIAFALPLVLAAILAGTAPAAAQGDPAFARFEAAIAETKKAIMADPQAALGKARAAFVQAQALPQTRAGYVARATALWLRIEANLGLNRLSTAQELISPAVALVERAAPRSKLHGDLMRSRGAIAGMSGRAQDALRDYLAAFQIFAGARELRSQAITLQDIGQIYFDAGDYERVVRYYEQANDLYDADPGFAVTNHNNLGETYRVMGRGALAEREYQVALQLARTLGSRVLEVRILNNLALVQLGNGKRAAATRSAERALALATGEAADWRHFVYGVQAKIAASESQEARAVALLERAFAGMKLADTELIYKDFHELAAQLYERLGLPQQALAHLKAYQRLDSETRNLTASAGSQLLAARFDFANQNLRISQLKQGQLERDVKIERQRTRFRTILFSGLAIAGAIVLLLMLLAFFSIRRSRNEVRAANEVLTETNAKLAKALRAKTEFLATTSHEIRTPLNGILGMTQILLANRRLDPQTRDQVQVVHGAGEAMRVLVDDILDVAKMETGRVEVASAPVRLPALLKETARLWTGQAEAKGLALHLDVDRAPATIRSDADRLRQVIGNLLSNAIKFTAAGSVTLRALADADSGRLVIEIADTGIGIPGDQIDLVFEAFHQVDGGTTRQFSGTGLGLSICRNLAGALGGEIGIASELGRGSTFTLRLPLEIVEEDAAPAVGALRPATLAAARLLLVEANPLSEGMLRALLEPAVASVDCVRDGAAALEEIAAGTVDHLLMDAKASVIAGMGPIDSIRLLAERGGAAGVTVSLLLPPSEDYPVDAVAAAGASQLILKPISGSQLIARLTQHYDADAPSLAAPVATAA